MKNKNFHINEDQLIIAVIDQNDLPAAVRLHLSKCPACQEKKRQLDQELGNLGRMAREFAPLPKRKASHILSHILDGIQKTNTGLWSWRPLFAASFAALFLIAGIWMTSPPVKNTSQEQMTARIINEMEEDQYFILEIKALEENALPDFYPYVSGESDRYFDEEFINFVVPVEETNSSV